VNVPARPILVTSSAVVSAVPATAYSTAVGVASAGQTLKLHDCGAIGDAAAGNEKVRLATDAVGNVDFGNAGAFFAVGITAVLSGAGAVASVVVG
jgi:hypothetical protein